MSEQYKNLPKVDEILRLEQFKTANKEILKKVITEKLEVIRAEIKNNTITNSPTKEQIILEIQNQYKTLTTSSIKPLINATGVVLQTNLGRAIFSKKILDEIFPLLTKYTNLEYDQIAKKRSERYVHIKNLLCSLLRCEDAIVVNNNASAVLLVLNTFGLGKEVVVSRGELVEIGGSFRVPEIMKTSGARLVEVGTTNKTHIGDYENAITQETSILMKAHQSNFKQIGFTKSVPMEEITSLAKKHSIIDYYDLGSGYMEGLNVKSEPSLMQICKKNPSLLSFSGDKLFGGPQAGIIIGRADLIKKLKENHLLRALRVDKFTILALDATLRAYVESRLGDIPTLNMINQPQEEIKQKAHKLKDLLNKKDSTQIVELDSLAGGGSLPDVVFKSFGISIPSKDPEKIESLLRENNIIARIKNDEILLDMRCLNDDEIEEIAKVLNNIL